MLKTSSQTVRTHVCCSQMKVCNLQEKQKKKGIYILSAREASFDLRSSNPVLKREARRLCGSDGLENLKCLFFLSCITKTEVHSCSDRILGFLHLWIYKKYKCVFCPAAAEGEAPLIWPAWNVVRDVSGGLCCRGSWARAETATQGKAGSEKVEEWQTGGQLIEQTQWAFQNKTSRDQSWTSAVKEDESCNYHAEVQRGQTSTRSASVNRLAGGWITARSKQQQNKLAKFVLETPLGVLW